MQNEAKKTGEANSRKSRSGSSHRGRRVQGLRDVQKVQAEADSEAVAYAWEQVESWMVYVDGGRTLACRHGPFETRQAAEQFAVAVASNPNFRPCECSCEVGAYVPL